MCFCLSYGAITWERGADRSSPFTFRRRTRRSSVAFVHRRGSPKSLCVIFSTCTPFLCVVNVSVINVVAERSASVEAV